MEKNEVSVTLGCGDGSRPSRSARGLDRHKALSHLAVRLAPHERIHEVHDDGMRTMNRGDLIAVRPSRRPRRGEDREGSRVFIPNNTWLLIPPRDARRQRAQVVAMSRVLH